MLHAQALVNLLDEIVGSASGGPVMSVAERSGLYAASREAGRQVTDYIERRFDGDQGNAKEKLSSVLWHIAAALGIDDPNGHPPAQHVAWAVAEAESLRACLRFDHSGGA